MSTIACLVLLALVGALCSGDRVRGGRQPPQGGCFSRGRWYSNGQAVGQMGQCVCRNGAIDCIKYRRDLTAPQEEAINAEIEPLGDPST